VHCSTSHFFWQFSRSQGTLQQFCATNAQLASHRTRCKRHEGIADSAKAPQSMLQCTAAEPALTNRLQLVSTSRGRPISCDSDESANVLTKLHPVVLRPAGLDLARHAKTCAPFALQITFLLSLGAPSPARPSRWVSACQTCRIRSAFRYRATATCHFRSLQAQPLRDSPNARTGSGACLMS
jgi:hypothetical protein